MEEFQEVQEHYFSLPEQRHRLVAELKNQGVGQATFRIGQQPRVRVQIDRVVAPPWLSFSSPDRVQAFRRAVYAAHPQFYQTPEEAQAEIRTRQRERFARVFDYDWFQAALPPGTVEILPPLLTAPEARDVTPAPESGTPSVAPDDAAAAASNPPARRFTR